MGEQRDTPPVHPALMSVMVELNLHESGAYFRASGTLYSKFTLSCIKKRIMTMPIVGVAFMLGQQSGSLCHLGTGSIKPL